MKPFCKFNWMPVEHKEGLNILNPLWFIIISIAQDQNYHCKQTERIKQQHQSATSVASSPTMHINYDCSRKQTVILLLFRRMSEHVETTKSISIVPQFLTLNRVCMGLDNLSDLLRLRKSTTKNLSLINNHFNYKQYRIRIQFIKCCWGDDFVLFDCLMFRHSSQIDNQSKRVRSPNEILRHL